MPIRLNPELDREAIARALARDRRAVVSDVLTPDGAERVLGWLERETPWSFTWFEDRAAILPHDRLESVTPGEWQALQRRIFLRAREAFAYAYHVYTLGRPAPLQRRGVPVEAFFDFLNGEEMLDFIRTVLDEPEVKAADAQATRFGPGQFLGLHNDLAPGHDRRVAYVFQFTPRWRPDWGGELVFPTTESGRGEVFLPGFNRLHLFRVPQDHHVNVVAPFAGGYRYAISGWFTA
ncbi:MAG: proline hydroxylase [Rhodothalassiaceae bacterium]|nr:MAG: proline hydroxylase [Rhodothalassiaceae bacterium]